MSELQGVLWERLEPVFKKFEHEMSSKVPGIRVKAYMASNDPILLSAYVAFSRSDCGREIALCVDLKAKEEWVSVDSDVCFDDGELILDGPSTKVEKTHTKDAAERELDDWVKRFQEFLRENEDSILRRLSGL